MDKLFARLTASDKRFEVRVVIGKDLKGFIEIHIENTTVFKIDLLGTPGDLTIEQCISVIDAIEHTPLKDGEVPF